MAYYFDAERAKQEVVQWIRDWFAENGPDCKAVVGISGGKDSSVVAALCVEALGANRVHGVLMPNGTQPDIDDSRRVVKSLKIAHSEINIAGAVGSIETGVQEACGHVSEQTAINLPARIRMAALYAVSQTVNGRVANTCNLSEDYIGYATRWGDSVGDFSPLANLTTDEVIAIGLLCNLPEDLVKKTPSDGLCGKTDEDALGFTYKELNDYIRGTGEISAATQQKIVSMHIANRFKMEQILTYHPSLDVFNGVEPDGGWW